MAIRTQEELMSQFSTIIGEENTSDEVLNFMTDMRDTLADGGSDTIASLRKQVADTEATWRKKYRDAFMGNRENIPDDDPPDPPKAKTFDDLFTTK